MQNQASTGIAHKTISFGQNGISTKGFTTKLVDVMKQRRVQPAQTQPRYSNRQADNSSAGMRMSTPRSVQTEDPRHQDYMTNFSTRDHVNGNDKSRLLEEAIRVQHVKKDFSYMPSVKNALDNSQASATGQSMMSNSFAEIRRTIEECERQKYSQILKRQLLMLLLSLDVPNSQALLSSEPSMETIALEIRRRFQNDSKSNINSSRIIKKVSTSMIEDPEEAAREIRRLKELVVKLQNEINVNMKKSANQRIIELYEDNQNYQRKVADLIDQLKRKEQEILLIPVGKVAEERIDHLKNEIEAYKRKLSQQKKSYEEHMSHLRSHSIPIDQFQSSNFFPKSNDTYLDPSLLQTVIEQKQIIAEQNSLIVNLREETTQFEQNLRSLEDKKLELERKTSFYESFLTTNGHDLNKFSNLQAEPSPRYVIETPRSRVEDRYELETQLDNLMALKVHLNKIKNEVNRGS